MIYGPTGQSEPPPPAPNPHARESSLAQLADNVASHQSTLLDRAHAEDRELLQMAGELVAHLQ